MTEPLPIGCMKKNPPPSWLQFNLIIKTVDLDDDVADLSVVDIEFNEKVATKQCLMEKEIFPQIIENK